MPTFEKTPVAWLERWFGAYRLATYYHRGGYGLDNVVIDPTDTEQLAGFEGGYSGMMFNIKEQDYAMYAQVVHRPKGAAK